MDPWPAEAWQALADELRAARDALGLTQAEFAAAAGIGVRTLQDLEAGLPRGRMPRTMPRVERAAGWRPGSARATLDGGAPVPVAALIPETMSREHKDVVRHFLEKSSLSPAAKKGLLAQLQSIPERD